MKRGRGFLIWVVRALLVIDALVLVAIPVAAMTISTDLAGEGMAMGYALFALVVGGTLLGGLAYAWRRAQAVWALVTVAILVALFTLTLGALLS